MSLDRFSGISRRDRTSELEATESHLRGLVRDWRDYAHRLERVVRDREEEIERLRSEIETFKERLRVEHPRRGLESVRREEAR